LHLTFHGAGYALWGTITPFSKHSAYIVDELNELIRSSDIVRFIKSKRIAWIGHVMRMEETRIPKRLLEWKPMGRRIRGRPRKRWLEDIEDDIHTMGIRG
jgi:hypothetical protein